MWRRCFNMANFKAQLERDLKAVFHNGQEFAEVKEIGYNGNYYKIPVVIDSEGAKDRQKPSTDNADGIFAVDMVMYAAYSDLPFLSYCRLESYTSYANSPIHLTSVSSLTPECANTCS